VYYDTIKTIPKMLKLSRWTIFVKWKNAKPSQVRFRFRLSVDRLLNQKHACFVQVMGPGQNFVARVGSDQPSFV